RRLRPGGAAGRVRDLAPRNRRIAADQAMSKGDLLVERGAARLEDLSRKATAKGGFAAKLADELAEDAVFLRKLKPSLIKARAKGQAPINRAPQEPRAPSPQVSTSRPPKRRRPKRRRKRS